LVVFKDRNYSLVWKADSEREKINCLQMEAKLVDVVPETGGQYNCL
jgi:hypothetical protein